MADEAPSSQQAREASEDELLKSYASGLAEAVIDALPNWVRASVSRHLAPDELQRREEQISAAAIAAADEVGGQLADLLALDIDDQWTNPLSILRRAARYPTEILASAGVPEVERDEHAKAFLPDDVYDLAPAAFSALGAEVHEFGIGWGAAKAHVHLRRRRDSGQR